MRPRGSIGVSPASSRDEPETGDLASAGDCSLEGSRAMLLDRQKGRALNRSVAATVAALALPNGRTALEEPRRGGSATRCSKRQVRNLAPRARS
jgi:hypothetical protein